MPPKKEPNTALDTALVDKAFIDFCHIFKTVNDDYPITTGHIKHILAYSHGCSQGGYGRIAGCAYNFAYSHFALGNDEANLRELFIKFYQRTPQDEGDSFQDEGDSFIDRYLGVVAKGKTYAKIFLEAELSNEGGKPPYVSDKFSFPEAEAVFLKGKDLEKGVIELNILEAEAAAKKFVEDFLGQYKAVDPDFADFTPKNLLKFLYGENFTEQNPKTNGDLELTYNFLKVGRKDDFTIALSNKTKELALKKWKEEEASKEKEGGWTKENSDALWQYEFLLHYCNSEGVTFVQKKEYASNFLTTGEIALEISRRMNPGDLLFNDFLKTRTEFSPLRMRSAAKKTKPAELGKTEINFLVGLIVENLGICRERFVEKVDEFADLVLDSTPSSDVEERRLAIIGEALKKPNLINEVLVLGNHEVVKYFYDKFPVNFPKQVVQLLEILHARLANLPHFTRHHEVRDPILRAKEVAAFIKVFDLVKGIAPGQEGELEESVKNFFQLNRALLEPNLSTNLLHLSSIMEGSKELTDLHGTLSRFCKNSFCEDGKNLLEEGPIDLFRAAASAPTPAKAAALAPTAPAASASTSTSSVATAAPAAAASASASTSSVATAAAAATAPKLKTKIPEDGEVKSLLVKINFLFDQKEEKKFFDYLKQKGYEVENHPSRDRKDQNYYFYKPEEREAGMVKVKVSQDESVPASLEVIKKGGLFDTRRKLDDKAHASVFRDFESVVNAFDLAQTPATTPLSGKGGPLSSNPVYKAWERNGSSFA